MERVSDIGEFGLIQRLTGMFLRPPDVIVGAGDDAAVFKLTSGQLVVATCDMLIEGVHFDLGAYSATHAGWRAMTASLSDVAAMGCKPRFSTVSIGVPQETPALTVEEIFIGLTNAAKEHSAAIVGGDTVKSPERIVIDVFMIGEPVGSRYLTRSGASDGDVIVVTGYPGQSAAGLEILLSGRAPDGGEEDLVRAHLEPHARVEQGLLLAQNERVGAAIDLSDGLAQDLGHICEMSRLGAVIDIEKLPISSQLTQYCEKNDKNAPGLCLSGGEDYELLFAVHENNLEALLAGWREQFDVPATAVGRMTSKREGVHLENPGDIAINDIAGYDHFRRMKER
jgi:thiamine-monophosphate kinase